MSNKLINYIRSALRGGFASHEIKRALKLSNGIERELVQEVIQSKQPHREFEQNFLGKVSFPDKLVPTDPNSLGAQGQYGTCVLGAMVEDITSYQIAARGQTVIRFYDEFGNSELITVNNVALEQGATGKFGMLEVAYAEFMGRYNQLREAFSVIRDGNEVMSVHRRLTNQEMQWRPKLRPGAKFLVVHQDTEELKSYHAYRIVGMDDKTVTVRNPWGFDGSGVRDGNPFDGLVTVDRNRVAGEFYYPVRASVV